MPSPTLPSIAEIHSPRRRNVLLLRLAVALVQAAALYCLVDIQTPVGAGDPPLAGTVFLPLIAMIVFAPTACMLGAGHLRSIALTDWTLLVALVAAMLGYFSVAREIDAGGALRHPTLEMSALWVLMVGVLFVAGHLIVMTYFGKQGGAASRYARYYLALRTLLLQGMLATAFVGLTWIVLAISLLLFEAIDVNAFADVVLKPAICIPVTTLAFALAIHAGDSRAPRDGVRILAVLKLLLPVFVVILTAFLCCLIPLSLEPLWRTGHAAMLLLGACALLIFLINSVYQDGAPERPLGRVESWSLRLGSLILLALALLAVESLRLRVRQYGWSADRVVAAAGVSVALGCAIGYSVGALRRRAANRAVATTNICMTLYVAALMLFLGSPLGDPARIMTQNQLHRLRTGAADPQTFDYPALAQEGARWGRRALSELALTPGDGTPSVIRAGAARALEGYATGPQDDASKSPPEETPETPETPRKRSPDALPRLAPEVSSDKVAPETSAETSANGAAETMP